MKSKKSRILIVLATLCLTLSGTVMNSAKASMLDQGYVNTCVDSGNNNSSSAKAGNNAPTAQTGSAGDNEKKVFDYMVQKEGFSGAGAAGATGNGAVESGFNPKADNGDCGGIFQWGYTATNGIRLNHGGCSPTDKSTWTFDNEMSNMDYELHHGYKKVAQEVGNADDPVKAADMWRIDYEQCGDQGAAQREQDAQQAYAQYGGANIKANSALLAAAGTSNGAGSDGGNSQSNSGQSSNPDCNNSSGSDAGQVSGDIVKNARALMGWFHYSQGNRTNFMSGGKKPDELKSKSDLNKDGNADCSSFVWLVLKESGYSVPANVGWYTKTMADDAKGPHKWFKQIDPKDAKPGDVIIVNEGSGEGSNGHTAIITSNWQGYDNTKCINEGGDDQTMFHNDGVCEDTIRKQFWTMLDNGDVTIAEPVKASNSK